MVRALKQRDSVPQQRNCDPTQRLNLCPKLALSFLTLKLYSPYFVAFRPSTPQKPLSPKEFDRNSSKLEVGRETDGLICSALDLNPKY